MPEGSLTPLQKYLAKQAQKQNPSTAELSNADSHSNADLSYDSSLLQAIRGWFVRQLQGLKDKDRGSQRAWAFTSASPSQSQLPAAWSRAEFGVRFAACLIDWVILLAIRHALRNYVLQTLWFDQDFWFLLVLALPYYGLSYSRRGASPGKLVMGLEVVDSRTGSFLPPFRAFFRETLGKLISALPIMVGFLIAAFRDDRKALHDMIFDTTVIRAPQQSGFSDRL